jgi:hypothetical protein
VIELTTDYEDLKAQAEGRAPFAEVARYEQLAEWPSRHIMTNLKPGERLALGLYLRAKEVAAKNVKQETAAA